MSIVTQASAHVASTRQICHVTSCSNSCCHQGSTSIQYITTRLTTKTRLRHRNCAGKPSCTYKSIGSSSFLVITLISCNDPTLNACQRTHLAESGFSQVALLPQKLMWVEDTTHVGDVRFSNKCSKSQVNSLMGLLSRNYDHFSIGSRTRQQYHAAIERYGAASAATSRKSRSTGVSLRPWAIAQPFLTA